MKAGEQYDKASEQEKVLGEELEAVSALHDGDMQLHELQAELERVRQLEHVASNSTPIQTSLVLQKITKNSEIYNGVTFYINNLNFSIIPRINF